METIAEFFGPPVLASDVNQMVMEQIAEAAKSEGLDVDATSVKVSGEWFQYFLFQIFYVFMFW